MDKIAFRSRMGVVLLICLVLLSALILVSLAVGTRSLTLEEILTGLAGQRKTVASIIWPSSSGPPWPSRESSCRD